MTDREKTDIYNCPNCGAPLDDDGCCKYCGSKRQLKSEIIIDATGIRFSVK